MQFTVLQMTNGRDEAARADAHPHVRLLTVEGANCSIEVPFEDLQAR